MFRLPLTRFYFRPTIFTDVCLALGVWERYALEVFTPKKGDIVIDIGAHIGYYTIVASKKVGVEGLVIAIEPDHRNIEILRRNTNYLGNVRIIECAISSRLGYADLMLGGDPAYSQLLEYVKDRTPRTNNYRRVEIKTLDILCDELNIKPNWLKIDVEDASAEIPKAQRIPFKAKLKS